MEHKTIEPPSYLDGARVLKWAWSGQYPFGYLCDKEDRERVEIYGLAICKYDDSNSLYRFSCDKDWEVVNDSPEDSIENAIKNIPDQYKNAERIWRTK
jgi:hypothetical protein